MIVDWGAIKADQPWDIAGGHGSLIWSLWERNRIDAMVEQARILNRNRVYTWAPVAAANSRSVHVVIYKKWR